MYGTEDYYGEKTKLMVRMSNEQSIANLIAIFNTPAVFDRLSDDTKESIIKVLGGYAKATAEAILISSNQDAKAIKEAANSNQL